MTSDDWEDVRARSGEVLAEAACRRAEPSGRVRAVAVIRADACWARLRALVARDTSG